MDHFIIEDVQGELRRLQHLGEKAILPKVVQLSQWKEDVDKRLEHADKRLSFIQNAQKLHRCLLGQMRDEVADELHSWAKKEIEKTHHDMYIYTYELCALNY